MNRNQFLRLLSYVRHYWYLLPFVLVSMIAATLLDLAAPWITGVILIDRVIIARDASLLPWVVLGLLGAVTLRQAFEFSHRYFLALLSQRTIHHLRCDLYQHIEGLPVSFFAGTPVGDLVSRQVSDADAIEEGLKAFVTEAGVAGLTEGDLARRLGVDAEAMTAVAAALLAVSKKPRIFIAPDVVDSLGSRMNDELARFQKKNPLLDGMPKSELREKTAARAPLEAFEWVLAKRVAEGGLRSVKDLVATVDHRIQMSPEETQAREFLVAEYRESGYRPKNLSEAATNGKRDVRLLERVQRVLLKDGTLVQIADGLVFHRDVLEELKETVRGYKTKRDSIDVGFFKEMAGVTRKYAIPLLEWLDRERVTQRAGNSRRIL